MTHSEPEAIRRLLALEVWAFVGLTHDPFRTVFEMASFLAGHRARIVPVNPGGDAVLGQPGFAHLSDIPFGVDVVAVYRRAQFAGPHFDEAIAIKAAGVWTPLGVVDEAAAARATDAGLTVVMDRCPKIEWPTYGPATR